MMTENEIIDIEDFEEIDNSAMFQRSDRTGAFKCCLLLINYCRLNTDVWWGYRWFYNLACFLPAFIAAVALDVAIITIAWLLVAVWDKVISPGLTIIMDLFRRFTTICVSAVAILAVILFVYNYGWAGLNEMFLKLCGK